MKEFIIDTNVFIRYLIRDVPRQFEKAKKLFSDIENQKIKGFVSILVINEIIWILENYYELKRPSYIPKLIKLFALKNIKIAEIEKDIIFKIFETMQKGNVDFTDLYLFYTSDKDKIFSFDSDFKKI